ncbi:dihydrolipoyl dehydrogenase [Elizabethkingia meningoseptica]|uniref:dihydrolipoyl dehydrogenase n=1 Tax=Elizabethkingia meningoseptica TaxID=238 RepID=UPI0023AF9AC3|nr:dihydrolipoyl dehydrogenase [Elizabethkingia meningoseptica]MDE5439634.1 dihydrolipoyl dehydrogenase [Elizabethkingia meningoseptica]MDE5510303.1 dihydrolipoyl dehydrogenase [Elizabethkingia meningoseptica]MDE5517452.1 dihydrolipoyl dehydrogenase [Elizabethkingia meningoseptica]MDE5528067.1 dihydrolipoyl dehydrogenase [Elizabethkingia meningoseptica]MDE5531543.1 dihydrolipoyl dehydrogenase [Elizabethkingia meningoseptica]
MESYDIAVIGSGPGGYVAAIRSAQLGYRTVLVEKYNTLGGTCTNVGCIPTKALLDSTHHYSDALKKFEYHGINIGDVKLDFEQMFLRKADVVLKNTEGLEFLMKKNKITRITGTASFVDNSVIKITSGGGEQQIKANHFIIATGSKPASLPGINIDKERIITSTEALSLKELPKSMVIIGGGVIGVEMASIFNRLGTKVTILEYADHLISAMDHELGKTLQKILKKDGIDIRLQQSVYKAENTGGKTIVNFRDKNGTEDMLEAEYVLVAVGRKPYTEGLGLENTEVKLNERGFIITGENLQTTAPGIYAIGDVVGGAMLAHKAEEEGVLVAEVINGQKPHIHYSRIPSVVYTWPEVASVGATEEELQKNNIAYQAGKFPFSASARARASMDTEGFAKVLVDPKYGEILGVHIIGPRAADSIAQAVVALEYEVTAKDMFSISYAHPTYTETLKEAYMLAYGQPAINI